MKSEQSGNPIRIQLRIGEIRIDDLFCPFGCRFSGGAGGTYRKSQNLKCRGEGDHPAFQLSRIDMKIDSGKEFFRTFARLRCSGLDMERIEKILCARTFQSQPSIMKSCFSSLDHVARSGWIVPDPAGRKRIHFSVQQEFSSALHAPEKFREIRHTRDRFAFSRCKTIMSR